MHSPIELTIKTSNPNKDLNINNKIPINKYHRITTNINKINIETIR